MPKVVLVTPYYGLVSLGLHQTLNGAVKDRSVIQVAYELQASASVLPDTFNTLLAIAYQLRDDGKATHLAMAHSDVLAERGWLDKLWAEMWWHRAELMSTVIPIKGPSGRTSTAVGTTEDPWTIRRCIYDRHKESLPATFGTEHVTSKPDEFLMVNTGLFLADLRAPWWETPDGPFAFTFHNRIVRRQEGGYEAQGRSEDWEMSRYLHLNKVRYGATWKVKIRHEGLSRWANYQES